MPRLSETAAAVAVGYGLLLLYLAAFFPRALAWIPGNHWLHQIRYPATRTASVLLATTLVLAGLHWMYLIPRGLRPWVPAACGLLLAAAVLHDVLHYRRHGPLRDEPPPRPRRR